MVRVSHKTATGYNREAVAARRSGGAIDGSGAAVDGRMNEAPEEALFKAMSALDNLLRASMMKSRDALTKTQVDVVLGLSAMGPMNMTQVSEHIAASREQATRAVAPLVERGLLAKERNPENRRVVEVSLTERGRRFFEEGSALAVAGLRERLAVLPAPERERLFAACREVADVLGDLKRAQA